MDEYEHYEVCTFNNALNVFGLPKIRVCSIPQLKTYWKHVLIQVKPGVRMWGMYMETFMFFVKNMQDCYPCNFSAAYHKSAVFL